MPLHDRFDFLIEAILDIWSDPGDEKAVAVAHTMMRYYSDLTTNRRAGDRRYKGRAHHKNSSGRVSRDEPLLDEVEKTPTIEDEDMSGRPARWDRLTHSSGSPPMTGLNDNQLRDLAEHFHELSRIECDRGCTCWEYDTRSNDDDQVTIAFRCECGETDEKITIGQAAFVAAGRKFFDVKPNEK